MSDYNDYITAVNKIFDYLAKMKVGWNNQDNMNYIESIEEYKDKVINNAEKFKQQASVSASKPVPLDTDNGDSLPTGELNIEETEEEQSGVSDDSLEALGND